MTNEMKKEIVVQAINGMNKTTLKEMVGKYITYIPGSADEYLRPKKIRNQAVEIYHAMFAEMYEGLTGIKGEDAPDCGDDVCNAVERICDMLDCGISVRGIYRDWDKTGLKKWTYVYDNITYKESGVYVADGGSLTMDDINQLADGVDVFLMGEDIKKEMGL